jgi:demethylmenaquinone methyltransferase/2-methoxy-6-polyprenyl-1,4-benzoquinol methylase
MMAGPPARRSAGPPLGDLDPDAHLRDPARKQRYVTTVFATVGPSYDRFTRWFSFGMDRRWKARVARWAMEGVSPGEVVVDLACGTGDLILAGRRAGWRAGVVIGLDASDTMLDLATRRLIASRIPAHQPAGPPARLIRGDMLAIPIRDGAAAAVTIGYGFRNVPDLGRALGEARRVLRPGGRLVSLDFFRPGNPGWRGAFLWYLRQAGRLVGRWWHGEPEAYGYIARSLETWLTPAGFAAALEAAGFTVEGVSPRLGGGICLHRARAPG